MKIIGRSEMQMAELSRDNPEGRGELAGDYREECRKESLQEIIGERERGEFAGDYRGE